MRDVTSPCRHVRPRMSSRAPSTGKAGGREWRGSRSNLLSHSMNSWLGHGILCRAGWGGREVWQATCLSSSPRAVAWATPLSRISMHALRRSSGSSDIFSGALESTPAPPNPPTRGGPEGLAEPTPTAIDSKSRRTAHVIF